MANTHHRMKISFIRQAISALFGLGLLVLAPTQTVFANQITENKGQLHDLLKSIAEKEKSVKEQQAKRSALLEQLKQQEQSISAAGRSLHETQNQLKQLDKEIVSLNSNIKQLQTKKQQQEKLLADQLDAAFRLGKHQGLTLMFKGEEGQREERILAYYSYLNQAREKNIVALEETTKELQEQKQLEQKKQAEQKTTLARQQQEKRKLDNARTSRQKTLNVLESTLKEDQKNLAVLKQNEARLRDKIAKAEREAKARAEREAKEAARIRVQVAEKERQAKQKGSTYKPSESERSLMSRTGGLGRPAGQAIWPVRGSLLHNYGDVISSELRWKGMVIAANEGTQVKAIADGRVLLADWLQGYGLVVVVEHGKGDMSLYGYNQSALVNVGQEVRAGQPIALVGSSGGQERPALYFEIRRQGKTVNPRPWLGR
ncbi:murein hydrolase activator EnvC [Providencia huaxiensis]|uniref:murein hydrolase activator EnvC n=1 Tax=Providencia TaxID=586 RepID=UPI00189CFDAE|nr:MULTISPECIES: murein hydrolase activator EnvC [Providencia]MBN6361306.1 murein hydrolase activator EnvC [Providencia huaxiensis]MCD2528860.1 murein hydrolase activator EnvC [Providencia huaxiensis]QPE17525.1 murein hydrolase activator EnvC [Providencia rettgeri]